MYSLMVRSFNLVMVMHLNLIPNAIYPPCCHAFSHHKRQYANLLIISSQSPLLLLSLHFLEERIALFLLLQLLITALVLLHICHILTTRHLAQSSRRPPCTLLLFLSPAINAMEQVIDVFVVLCGSLRCIVDHD